METTSEFSRRPSGDSWKAPALIVLLIALMAATGYLMWRVRGLVTEVRSMQGTLSQLSSMASVNAAHESDTVRALREKLESSKAQAAASAGQAKTEAQRLARRLAAQQRTQQQKMTLELSEVKQTASNANAKLADVSNEVAATKSQLDKTTADLKSVTGDMGVMSGKIATNAEELTALKALGGRNYFEFNVERDKLLHKVGDVRIRLKKADPKRNKYTLEVLADDRQVEKKDKTVNEPVQFYLSKARQPYEIVVNEVKKDEIVGYLATPKVEIARK